MGKVRLPAVAFVGFQPRTLEDAANPTPLLLVELERKAERVGHAFSRHVVMRRPQSPRNDDSARVVEAVAQQRRDAFAIVTDRVGARYVDADAAEDVTDKGQVCVAPLAFQQLIADQHDLDFPFSPHDCLAENYRNVPAPDHASDRTIMTARV
jgi:hypothetical protein